MVLSCQLGSKHDTVSAEEGCSLWRANVPLWAAVDQLRVYTSLPHSEPMQVPTRVANFPALARASSRLQHLAVPRVKKETYCYKHSFLESVIRPVRQCHPGACTGGTLGRGEGLIAQFLMALFMAALDVLLSVRLI